MHCDNTGLRKYVHPREESSLNAMVLEVSLGRLLPSLATENHMSWFCFCNQIKTEVLLLKDTFPKLMGIVKLSITFLIMSYEANKITFKLPIIRNKFSSMIMKEIAEWPFCLQKIPLKLMVLEEVIKKCLVEVIRKETLYQCSQ